VDSVHLILCPSRPRIGAFFPSFSLVLFSSPRSLPRAVVGVVFFSFFGFGGVLFGGGGGASFWGGELH